MAHNGDPTTTTYTNEGNAGINKSSNIADNKAKEKFSCNICNLTFTNNCILESHLAGKRHQKMTRSRNLGGLVKDCNNSSGVSQTGAAIIGQFFCKECGIYANSASQLEVHIKSSKHINKVEKNKGAAVGNASNDTPQLAKKKGNPDALKNVTPAKKAKSDSHPEVFKCIICNVDLNSKTQYEQHIASNKHKNKVNPNQVPKSKSSSAKRKGAAYMAKKREARLGLGYDKPLSTSFVSGGSYDNQTSNATLPYAMLYGRNKQYTPLLSNNVIKPFKQSEQNFNSNYTNTTTMARCNEEYRNSGYGRMSTNLEENYNFMSAQSRKSYYDENGYTGSFGMSNQTMNSQYSLPAQYNSQNSMKGSFSLW